MSKVNHISILQHKLGRKGIKYQVVGGKFENPKWVKPKHIPTVDLVSTYWKNYAKRIQEQTSPLERTNSEFVPNFNPETILPICPQEKPIEILGIVKGRFPIMIAVKLPGNKTISLVPSDYLHQNYPRQLSKFYEERICFENISNSVSLE